MSEREGRMIPWILRKKVLLLEIIIVFVAALGPFFLNRVQRESRDQIAESPNTCTASDPAALAPPPQANQVVDVGVYILSLGNLDTTNGTYDANFFLNFVCKIPGCDPTKFDVMNAAEPPDIENQTSPESSKKGKFYYRVHARLLTNLDLHDFPFDKHTLQIDLEDKNSNNSELGYVINKAISGIDNQVIVAGWRLDRNINGAVSQHKYSIFEEDYSRASFCFQIDHPWFSSFMKGLFAAIVIVLIGMLSFAMRHDATTDRLALTSSTLVGAILYHLTLTSSIPPVGYLTFADSFMMLNYIFVFLALGITVALLLFMDNNEEKKAIWLHNHTRIVVPLMWLVASTAMTISQFVR